MSIRVASQKPIQIRASPGSTTARGAVVAGPPGPQGPPGPGSDITGAEILAARDAAVAANPHVGTTPPADTSRIWIDTGSVFTTDIRTARDTVSVTVGGTVTVTLGATPTNQSELIWRTRAGATLLLVPGNYTLTGTTLSVPSAQVGDVLTIRYNYQAVNGTSAATAISDQPLIADSFDRANSTTTLGNTETGQPWFVGLDPAGGQPAWGIISNTAYIATNPNNSAYAMVNTGVVDHTVQVKMTFVATNGSYGLAVASDANGANCYATTLTGIVKRTNGVSGTALFNFPAPLATTDTLRITRKGDTVTCYQQVGSTGTFNQIGTATDATFHGTYAGMRGGTTSGGGRWDDFKVFPA